MSCGGYRTILYSWFSPSTFTWDPRTELKLQAFVLRPVATETALTPISQYPIVSC